jgi:hypothetical protein
VRLIRVSRKQGMLIRIFFFNFVDLFTALRFTVTGAPVAFGSIRIFANESACLMADNIWNEGQLLTCGLLDDIMFHGEQWEFIYDFSVVGSSYQLH